MLSFTLVTATIISLFLNLHFSLYLILTLEILYVTNSWLQQEKKMDVHRGITLTAPGMYLVNHDLITFFRTTRYFFSSNSLLDDSDLHILGEGFYHSSVLSTFLPCFISFFDVFSFVRSSLYFLSFFFCLSFVLLLFTFDHTFSLLLGTPGRFVLFLVAVPHR